MSQARLALEQVDVEMLADLLDQNEWGAGFFRPATGEVFPGMDGVLDDPEDEIDEAETIVELGGGSSHQAYGDMETFVAALADRRLAERLERAIEGKGAFRRFRDVLHHDADETTTRAWTAFSRARSTLRALVWLRDGGWVVETDLDTAAGQHETAAAAALQAVGVPARGVRLILLNGMPGAGKSTLAARYLADHPGVLCVEADELRRWIGGDPDHHAEAARHLGLALATAHLEAGYDVVVPQLVARVDQVERFATAAAAVGAEFVEVVVHGVVVEARVPDAVVEHLLDYAHGLAEVVVRRPSTHRIVTRHGDVDDAYRDLLDVLDPDVPA